MKITIKLTTDDTYFVDELKLVHKMGGTTYAFTQHWRITEFTSDPRIVNSVQLGDTLGVVVEFDVTMELVDVT